MKVNQSTGQTGGLQNANSTSASDAAKKTAKTDSSKARGVESEGSKSVATDGATAEISFRAREMAKAKEAASAAPDVREGKVAELKRRIESGEYSVSANKIADKLVDEQLKTAAMS